MSNKKIKDDKQNKLKLSLIKKDEIHDDILNNLSKNKEISLKNK